MSSDNKGFLTDFKKIQVISAITATSGVFMTIAALFIFPIPIEAKLNILLISGATLVFNLVYYLIPSFYMNPRIVFIPSLVYITALSLVMANLGEFAYIYFIFFMILAAIDAFIFPLYQYVLIIIVMLVAIIISNPTEISLKSSQLPYEMYGLVVIAVVLHAIAGEAVSVREAKNKMGKDVEALENEKREINALLESLSDGMFVVDKNNKIKFLNKSALKILKIIAPEEKVIGRDINDFMPTIGSRGPEPITREVFGTLENSIRNDFKIVQAEKTIRLHTNITFNNTQWSSKLM